MFTKQDIEKMFADNEGKTFVVKTNNGNGHGINGVDYDRYISRKYYDESESYSHYRKCTEEMLDLVEVTDGMLILSQRVTKYRKHISLGKMEDFKYYNSLVYLPLSAVCSVEFIDPESGFIHNCYGAVANPTEDGRFQW